jgi:hypothetical protein
MMFRSANETSRQDIGRGAFDHPAGSRGAKKQYNQRAEIVRMPSGSIVSIPSFEEFDTTPTGLHRALMFALPISIILWGLIGLAVWLLVVAIR